MFSSERVYGQNACELKLDQANDLYDEAKFEKAIELLSECVKDVGDEIRWKSYRLMSLSYLELGQREKALEAAGQMLLLYPKYKPDLLFDTKEFIRLLKEVKIIPRFSLGVSFSAGTVLSLPRLATSYDPTPLSKEYSNLTGFRVGFSVGYNINRRHSVGIVTQFSDQKHELKVNSERLEMIVTDKNKFLNFSGLYSLTINPLDKLQVHLMAGGFADLLIQSVSDYRVQGESALPDLIHRNAGDRRRNWIYGLTGGVSVSQELGNGRITVNGLYSRSLRSLSDPKYRYSDFKLIFDYDYIEDDVYLDNLVFSWSYYYYISYKLAH